MGLSGELRVVAVDPNCCCCRWTIVLCFTYGALPSTTNTSLIPSFRKSRTRKNKLLKIQNSTNEPPHDKTNKVTVRSAKTQISLGIHPVWSESSLCAWWVAKDPRFLHAGREDSEQTGQMPRLISVFTGCTHFVGFVMSRLKYYYHKMLLLVVKGKGTKKIQANFD